MNKFKPKATFTLFSLTTCGYCKVFKGEKTDKNGNVTIDPKSGWELLKNDPELYNAGVEFVLYQVGTVKDPKTGQIKKYTLGKEHRGRFKGFPHLELSLPKEDVGIGFEGRLSGWEGGKTYPVIKKWILEKLKTEPFKSYEVNGGKHVFRQASTAKPIKPPSQVPSGYPEPQNRGIDPSQIPKAQEAERQTPTVFGLGTKDIKIIDNNNRPPVDSRKITKHPPKFYPANYDN